MSDKLARMSKEELELSLTAEQMKLKDPNLLARLQVYLPELTEELADARKDLSVSPEYVQELATTVKFYSKLLAAMIKMNMTQEDKESAFLEADISAQEKEVKKYMKKRNG